ncbi:hypothetical protein AB3Z07_26490 (plasmid) [Metabacillus halosaccharovorans]|nr:hypothetical protein [Metabacillus halosaccharovorans]
MVYPEKPEWGYKSFVAIQKTIEPEGNNQLNMKFEGEETKYL